LNVDDVIEELAPAVVVRAALFPISTLDALADDELVRIADEATDADAEYESAYEASMRRQRESLARHTIDQPRFGRALCMTNEELSDRITAQRSSLQRSGKRARRLDATLYHYLARAVWRTEPCDLWTGVTIAEWGDETSVADAPARHAVSPDLRPYQRILQELAETDEYFERGRFKLNPTLVFDPGRGRWRYTVRSFSSIITCERSPSPGLDELLRVLGDLEPTTLQGVVEQVRGHGIDHDELDEAIAMLHEIGLLIGGLALPRRFTSPWDALFAASHQLDDDHARAWRGSAIRLRRLCRRLERRMDTIAVNELRDVLREARTVPTRLARVLGVDEPPLPRSVLRCDTRLPCAIVLGPETKQRLAEAVAEYDRYERDDGLDAAVRTAHRALVLGDTTAPPCSPHDDGRIHTLESAWREAGESPLVGRRLQQLARWLDAPAEGRPIAPAPADDALAIAPIAALVLRPDDGGCRIVGSTTEVCAAYGRYGELWYGIASPRRRTFHGNPVHEWYRDTLHRLADEAGVDIVEYLGPCEAMPNMLARPEFQFPVWDRWACDSSFRQDQLRVEQHADNTVTFARRDDASPRIALMCFSPANVGFSEPQLERLLLSSFREVPTWLDQTLPMERELVVREPSGPLRLPSGNYVKPRRTLVHGDELDQLMTAARSERFRRWRALARRHGWSRLLLVATDGQQAVPVVRDSPLAVEVGLRGLGERTRLLSVEELPEHTWKIGEEELGHAFEFIVPFLRRRHAWQALAPGEPRAGQ
jgi:hypothetical protein